MGTVIIEPPNFVTAANLLHYWPRRKEWGLSREPHYMNKASSLGKIMNQYRGAGLCKQSNATLTDDTTKRKARSSWPMAALVLDRSSLGATRHVSVELTVPSSVTAPLEPCALTLFLPLPLPVRRLPHRVAVPPLRGPLVARQRGVEHGRFRDGRVPDDRAAVRLGPSATSAARLGPSPPPCDNIGTSWTVPLPRSWRHACTHTQGRHSTENRGPVTKNRRYATGQSQHGVSGLLDLLGVAMVHGGEMRVGDWNDW